MKTFFRELFAYNDQVNRQLWGLFNANTDKTSEKARLLYSHIMNAHQIWNHRIDQHDGAFDTWQMRSLEACRELQQANHEHSLRIIAQLELHGNIQTKIKGRPITRTVAEILFHIINHSTYHRAQIATEFRQGGIDPLATDFLLFEMK